MAGISVAGELERANEDREHGVISQQQFAEFKAQLLASSVPAGDFAAVDTLPPTVVPRPTAAPQRSAGTPPSLPPPDVPPSRPRTAPRLRKLLISGIGIVVIALGVVFVAVIGHGTTPRQIVLASATRAAAANTVHMKVTVSFSGTPSFAGHSGEPVSVSASGEGAFDFTHKSATLIFSGPAASGGGTQLILERIIGPTIYLSSPSLPSADGGKWWVRIGLAQYEQKEGQSGLDAISNGDLSQVLGALRQHLGQTTDLGHATIDGVSTTHYRVMLTGTVTSTSLSGAVSKKASWPVDVWVDAHGRLSQMRLQFPFFGIEMSDTLTLSEYGSPVTVTPPPADQTANGTPLLNSGQLGQILNGS